MDALVQEPENECIISQLTTVEICSVFALKARTGLIATQELEQLQGRFFADLKARRFKVVVIEPHHLQMARDLIVRYGLSHALRTLDAIQLAAAMHLREASGVAVFVAADVRLCTTAAAEGFAVLNPTSAQ
jgi:hypothetical protein